MYKTFYARIVFLLSATLLLSGELFASHNMGKDLQYQYIGVANGYVRYKVTVRYYRNCWDNSYMGQASTAPASVTLHIEGTPSGCYSWDGSLPQDASANPSNGTEVSQLCPSQLPNSGCSWSQTGSNPPYPGVQIYTYSDTVSVPVACTQITFGTDECCRNSSITNIPNASSDDLSIIATVNNVIDTSLGITNNSVAFTNQPVPFFCLGSNVTFNHGAVDPDGDSLVYSLVYPMMGFGLPYTNLTFNTGYSVTQPVRTSPPNSFQFNMQTGQMQFVPAYQENDVLAMRVDEYRNGVWVGSTMRDIQVVILNCAIAIPQQDAISNIQNGNQQDSLTVQVCPGTPLQFDIACVDPANHNLTITSNLNSTPSSIPGAHMTQIGSGDSVIARVAWTPLAGDTGCHDFIITAKNDDCPINGSNTRVYNICVFTKVQLLAASPTYCGTPVQLTATGGTNYTWTPSTGPNAVSNPNSYHPTVSPVAPTMYYFTSDCGTDSVLVGSAPPFIYDAGPGGTICQNGQLQLNATTDNLYAPYHFQWMPSAGLIDPVSGLPNDTIPNPVASPLSSTEYRLAITGSNGCVNVDSLHVTVNGSGPNIVAKAQPTAVCPGDSVHLNIVTNPQSCGLTATPCQGNNVRAQIGTGTGHSPPSSPTQYPTIYGHYSNSARHQFLYLQSELLAQIGSGGSIDSIAFYITQVNTPNDTMQNFEIKMGCTQATVLNDWQPNLVTVFSPKNVPVGNAVGWKVHKLDFPYDWDGTSNLVVDICFNNSANSALNNSVQVTTTTFNSVYYSFGSSSQCGITGTPAQTRNNLRPNARFSVCVTDVDGLPISWTPNSGPDAPTPTDSVHTIARPQDPTIYHVDVTAANGCHSQNFVYVNVDTTIRFAAYPADTFFCSVTPLKLTTTTAGSPLPGNSFSYEFRNLNTNAVEYSGAQNNFTITPTVSTDYLVTLSGGTCTLVDTIHVRVGNNIPILLTVDSIKCNGDANGKIIAVPTGGTPPITYAWNGGGTTDSLTNLSPGIYRITVQDSQGCSGHDSVTLTQPSLLTVSASAQNILCNGLNNGSVSLTASGGTSAYSYVWNPAQPNTSTISGLAQGTYYATVTDANGCSVTDSATITQPTALTVTELTYNATSFGGSDGWAFAVVNGGTTPYIYAWSNSQTGDTISNLAAGNYCVTVTDAHGCTATACGTVTNPPPITLTFSTANNLCYGACNGTASVSATGGIAPYTFAWSGGLTGDSISNLCAGVYTVTATDSAGITVSGNINITQPAQIIIALDTTNITCYEANNGSVLATATGGTSPYTYNWNAGGSANPITSLGAGTYAVTATDAHSCTAQASAMVTEPPQLVVVISDSTNVACYGGNTGSATASVSGGVSSYTYQWSIATTSNPATGFAAGSQSVTVTDSHSCTASVGFVLTQPTQLTVAITSATNVTCNGAANGSIDIAASGGTVTASYTYSWSNGAATQNLTGAGAGNYTVVVLDGNGCAATTDTTLTEPTAVVLSFTHTDPRCTGDTNGSASVSATGGVPGYTYAWSSPSTTDSLTSISAGTYNVTVTDATACSVSGSVTLVNPISLDASLINKTEITCADAQDGSVEVTANGGTPPVTFLWSNSSTSNVINNLAPGTYNVTVQDVNGCDTTLNTTFVAPPLISIDALTVDSVSCPDYSDGSFHVSAIGGTPGATVPYQYSIDGTNYQSSEFFTGLNAGVYHVEIKDGQGCTKDTTIVVNQPATPQLTILPQDSSIELGQFITLVSHLTPYSGSDVNSYSWSPSTGLNCANCASVIATPYAPTQYTLTVNYLSDCSVSETVSVQVGNGEPYFVPNAFSPNGDGNNDVFTVYGNGLASVNMKIFNRWGEMVFESSNQWGGWDGTYKGVKQNPGVYTYIIEGVYLNGKKLDINGSVSLLR